MRTVQIIVRVLTIAAGCAGAAVGCGSSAAPALDAAAAPDAALDADAAAGADAAGNDAAPVDAAAPDSGGGDGATILGCFVPGVGVAPDRCTADERASYGQCVFDRCGAATASCFGESARSGSYGGACGPWLTCLTGCGCGNLPCLAACGQPPAPCQSCQETVTACQQTSCPRPACLQPVDAGAPDASDGGLPPLPLPDGGGVTCDDLMRCCLAIADEAKKAVCVGQVGPLRMLGGDALCGPAYGIRRMGGECP